MFIDYSQIIIFSDLGFHGTLGVLVNAGKANARDESIAVDISLSNGINALGDHFDCHLGHGPVNTQQWQVTE